MLAFDCNGRESRPGRRTPFSEQMDSTIPDTKLLKELLEDSERRHKHLCPRQVLGVRIGLRGLQALGLVDCQGLPRFRNERKRLLTIVETDGCGLDGIAVATDCAVGRRTLRVLDFGKVAATLVDTRSNRAVRISPSAESRELAGQYAPQARSRWHSYLYGYQIIPDQELLNVEEVKLARSVDEIISKPSARAICAQCGEEIINEREVLVDGRPLCRSCSGDAYYTVA